MDMRQRQDDGAQALNISRRNASGELYALRWDRQIGALLALAGPLRLEEIATLRPEDLTWQSGAAIARATQEEWSEQAVLDGEGVADTAAP